MSFPEGFQSKLPDVGTTIFTVMSRRAAEMGAVNVGQGFPDYPIDLSLASCVTDAVAAGYNQYAPMEGSVALRTAIASKIRAAGGREVDPETELTVTCGGAESIYSAIQAVVGVGHEAIVFDPAYDAYDPAVRLAGGRCIHIPLRRRRISASTGIGSAGSSRTVRGSSSSTIRTTRPAPWLPRPISMRWRRSRATGPSPCSATRCTSTFSTTAVSTSR